MPINRRIPPPPPSFGGVTTTMSSTPYHAASATANNAHKRLHRSRTTSTAAAGSGGGLGTHDTAAESEMPSLLPPSSFLMISATTMGGGGGAPKLMNDEVERFVTIAANIRAEMRDLSADTKDEMASHFQVRSFVTCRVVLGSKRARAPRPSAVLHSYLYMFLISSVAQALVDHILRCKKPPSGSGIDGGSRRHPHFPDSRLDKDVITRVMGLKVSELKDELSGLHNLSVADVAKHFGSRKNVLQNRLLNDLEGMLPPSDEGAEEGGGGENNDVAEQSQNAVTLQSTATARDLNGLDQPAEPSNDDDDDGIMEVVPTEEMLEDAPVAATTTTTKKEMLRSSRADGGVDNHLQSPPKVSEAAGDRCTEEEMELEQDPVVHMPTVVNAEFAAPPSSHLAPHVVESNWQRSNGAVDTTVASIPFDEITTAEMDGDANADAMMEADATKLEPVVEVDSCRKRSRSPAAPSSSSSSSSMSFVNVSHPSMCGKESSTSRSTSRAVEQVQSTFNNMSAQHSPLRKFAKVNDSGKGISSATTTVVDAPHHRSNNDDADVPTGKSLTDPGPSWVDQRTAELAKQSQTVPKPARSGGGGGWKASATTAPPLSSAATVSKLYADDKFPSTTSYQPQSAAAATKTQPRSGGGGIPTAPAAAAKGIPTNLIEKMRTKVRATAVLIVVHPAAVAEFTLYSHSFFSFYDAEQNLSFQRGSTVRRQGLPAFSDC
jgi:hypothetical protein